MRQVRSLKTRYLSVALIVISSACQEPLGSGVPLAVAVVRGVVSDGSGHPVVSASVGANNFPDPCPADANALGNLDARTDPHGGYRIEIPTLASPGIACIAVTVTPVGGVAKTVTGAEVVFKPQGSLPYDSVTVDVTIP